MFMKKILIFTAFAVIIGGVAMAQDTEKAAKKIRKLERIQTREENHLNKPNKIKNRERKQEIIHERNEAALHGENVSSLARNTESGPGKGEIVSQEARNGKVRIRENNAAKNHAGARGSSLQHSTNMRLKRGPGSGRK